MTLQGGCLCAAIRYTIEIPPVESRPPAPNAAPTPVADPTGAVEKKTTLLPLIEIDHCSSCRLAAGSIIQAWIVCPKSWVSWRLLPRGHSLHGEMVQRPKDDEYQRHTTDDVVQPPVDMCKSTYLSQFVSSKDVHRGFCGRCGTTLTYCYTGPKPGWTLLERNFDVALGTLDREFLELDGVRPDRQGWWSDGISWVRRMLRDGDQVNGMRLVRHATGSTHAAMDDSEK
jgi:hypothetical protein